MKEWKRSMSCLMVVLMLFLGSIISPVSAVEVDEPVQPDGSINQDVAEMIAGLFVQDYSKTGPDSTWSDDTIVSKTVLLYDEVGSVSAYSCELSTNGMDNGYVVVSAYPDIENVILEFADQASPVYEELDLNVQDQIVYTGPLEYYIDNGSETLVNCYNDLIKRDDIINTYKMARSGISTYGIISDPFLYAQSVYGGSYEAYEWRNIYENYVYFGRTSDYMQYDSNCTLNAITNIIKTYANYKNINRIKALSASYVLGKVAQYGLDHGYYTNAPANQHGGTHQNTKNTYIENCFDIFDIQAIVSEQVTTYANIKNSLDDDDLLVLNVYGHSYYNTHSMMGYAYTRLRNKNNGNYKSFVKVADGENFKGLSRYVDFSDAQANNGDFNSVWIYGW